MKGIVSGNCEDLGPADTPESGAAMLLASCRETGAPLAAAPNDRDAKGAADGAVPVNGAAGEALRAGKKPSGAAWPGEAPAPEPADKIFILGTLLTSCDGMITRLVLILSLYMARLPCHDQQTSKMTCKLDRH